MDNETKETPDATADSIANAMWQGDSEDRDKATGEMARYIRKAAIADELAEACRLAVAAWTPPPREKLRFDQWSGPSFTALGYQEPPPPHVAACISALAKYTGAFEKAATVRAGSA